MRSNGKATELPGTERTRNGGAEICTARAKQGSAQAQIFNAEHWQWNEWLRKS